MATETISAGGKETIHVSWCDCHDCGDCSAIEEAEQLAKELGAYYGIDGYKLDSFVLALDPDVMEVLQWAYERGAEESRKELAYLMTIDGWDEIPDDGWNQYLD